MGNLLRTAVQRSRCTGASVFGLFLLACSQVGPPPAGTWTIGGCAAMPDSTTCIVDGPIDLWSSDALGPLTIVDHEPQERRLDVGTLWTLEAATGVVELRWPDATQSLTLQSRAEAWGVEPADDGDCSAAGLSGAVAASVRTIEARRAEDPVPCRTRAVRDWQSAGWTRDASMEQARLAMAQLSRGWSSEDVAEIEGEVGSHDADLRYARVYVHGIIAREQGRHRDARRAFSQALDLAKRSRSSPLWSGSARSELADLASRSGDHDRALALLAPRVAAATQADDRFHAHLDIAWAMIHAAEQGVTLAEVPRSPVAMEPSSHLDLARQLALATPELAEHLPDVWVNLALLALQRGDLDAAEDALGHAEGSTWSRTEHWRDEARARLALARGDASLAQQIWTALAATSTEAGDLATAWRAMDGVARTHVALGQLSQADRAWSEAEREFMTHAAFVPMFHGREAFLARRRRAATDHTEARLALGDLHGAMKVLRRFRRQYLSTIRVPERVEAFDTAVASEWEDSLRRYASLRKQRESIQERVRAAPASERAALRERLQQLQTATDEVLDSGMTMVSTSLEAPASDPRDVLVAITHSDAGWLAIAAGRGTIRVARGAVPSALWPQLDVEAWADARWVLLPDATSDALDPHAAIPWLGERPMVWSLDAPARASQGGGNRALIVADPQRNLPSARREAEEVAALMNAQGLDVQVLLGRDATRAAVIDALENPTTSVFHYAGHGELGDDTWDARLALAEGTSLRIADVLAMERVPELVVLAGCETGVTPRPGASSFGLAQAFAHSGSQAVVATTRTIDDDVARTFSTAFHQAKPWAGGVEAGWNQAVDTVREQGADWRTFRLFVP